MARDTKAAPKPKKVKKPKKKRLAQVRQVYTMARQHDPNIGWWMALAFVAVLVLGLTAGALLGHPVYGVFVTLPLATLAAVFLLSRRAERAAYAAIEGQPGAGGAVLQGLRRGWAYEQEPIAVDGGRSTQLRDSAMVYRAVGRPGVVLIGEGPRGRAAKLLAAEQKKVARLTPNVPVTTYRLGSDSGADAVAPRRVIPRMKKLKKALTPAEVTIVNKRLNALGRIRPPLPMGIDPQRLRSAGRGRPR